MEQISKFVPRRVPPQTVSSREGSEAPDLQPGDQHLYNKMIINILFSLFQVNPC